MRRREQRVLERNRKASQLGGSAFHEKLRQMINDWKLAREMKSRKPKPGAKSERSRDYGALRRRPGHQP
jgi:hypothetical protein